MAAAPSSALSSAIKPLVGVTRSRSSRRKTVILAPACTCNRTSVVPGWVASTSLSRSTIGGVQRVAGTVMVTGPRTGSVTSGTLTSIAINRGGSSCFGGRARARQAAVHPDQPGRALVLGEPAADQQDGVLREMDAARFIGRREEQDLDRALE